MLNMIRMWVGVTNRDKQSTKYIERFADRVPASTALAIPTL